MKYLQGKFLTGYVTLHIKGRDPELLLQHFVNEGVHIWDVKKISISQCEMKIRLYDLQTIQQVTKTLPYEVTIKDYYGLPKIVAQFKRHLDILIAGIISIIFFILLSQFIWSIDINGVSEEVEAKVKDHLQAINIKQGSFKPFLANLSDIQQSVLKDVPELLWIGVEQKGTKLIFSGVEKIIQEEIEKEGAQHLVAKKNGVIEKMKIAKGVPLVTVNDYVRKGQRLVSGDLSDVFEEDRDQEETLVAAQGEVFARTWYEVDVVVPLKVHHEQLVDEQMDKYYLAVGNKQLLLWGFQKEEFKHSVNERNEYPLTIFNYKFPLKIVKETIYETKLHSYERSKEDAVIAGISEAKKSLQLQLEQNANILSHKVLHETTENGKVKLNLLITVSENIAEEIPIVQGD